MRRSNGIGGEHTMSYAYQGKGYDSTRNWGFLGFPATRVTDGASGIVTYHQYRLDFPYYAELAAIRQYDGTYDAVSGSADTFDEKLLFRQELAYANESLSHGSVLPYVEKAVEFHYEGGEQIGLTQTESALTLSGGLPTELAQTTRIAHGETHSGGSPWGAMPTYTLSDEQRKATTSTKFTNRTSGGKWLIGFANEIKRSDFAGGSSTATRERRTTFAHHPTSNRVDTMERFPRDPDAMPPRSENHPEHYLKTVYAYDTRGNHFSTTVSGANVAPRTSRAVRRQ